MYKIGCIGIGNMGSAMIKGALSSGFVTSDEVIVSAHSDQTLEKYETLQTTKDNTKVCQAKMILLTVKPNLYPTILEEIKPYLTKETILVTVAPGFSIDSITKLIGRQKIVRTMPNTPALVGCSMTGITCNDLLSEEEKAFVFEFFNSFGMALEVPENLMAAVGSASGSSPAFIYILIEAMADFCVKSGMKRQDALLFCAKSVEGSAKMVLETKEHPGVLKDRVCSPGGTTIEGVLALEKAGFRSSIQEGMEASYQKFLEVQE